MIVDANVIVQAFFPDEQAACFVKFFHGVLSRWPEVA